MPSVAGALQTLFSSPVHDQVGSGGGSPVDAGPLGLASATTFAGGTGPTPVVATQTQSGGNTVVHLQDGSTITVVGVTHLDASFFH